VSGRSDRESRGEGGKTEATNIRHRMILPNENDVTIATPHQEVKRSTSENAVQRAA
jgi:hypothetical protein